MSLAHLRTWRRLSLLAADALSGAERERALAHVGGCPRCSRELDSLGGALAEASRDPARTGEPGVPIEMLVRLTQARLDRAPRPARPERAWPGLWLPLAAAAALAALVLVPRLLAPVAERTRAGAPAATLVPPALARLAIDDDALRRLERRVVREQAARYLSDAGDVLVTVAASPLLCDRQRDTLDLAEESRRSRELLQRRALLVDFDSADVRAARPVLEDVDRVLREVATLDPCTRPEDLLQIHDQLRQRRLLMKIGLMARELQG